MTLEADCRGLTVYAVGSRYSDDLFEPTEQDSADMVAGAKHIRENVLQKLPSECHRVEVSTPS